MSGQLSATTVGGKTKVLPLTNTQAPFFITLIGISGWLLASLVRTPLPGAGPALLMPSLGALIMWAAVSKLRRHILR